MYVIRIKRNNQTIQVKNRPIQVKLASVGKRGIGLISGGTQGQYLRKATAADFEVEWDTITSDEISDAAQSHKFVTAAQLTLIDASIQPGDNITDLTNNAGYISDLSAFTTDDLVEGSNLYYTDVRADARITAQKGLANGLASLGSDGKVPTSQLPALALTETFVVNDQTEMLALTAQPGDIAVRVDQNKSYILTDTDPSVLGNWQELLTPTDSVLSVNGQTGAVTLTTTHIAEGTNEYYTAAKVTTLGDGRWIRDTGDTMTGKLLFSGVSSDFGIDLAGSALKLSTSLVIDGNPQNFNWPFTRHGLQPAAFMYLDSQFGLLRIGTQKPSTYNAIAFELPHNNEYQDAVTITLTSFAPGSSFNNTLNLGGASNRWKSVQVGSDGINSNGDLVLNSASVELTPSPSANVTESGMIASLTAGEDLVFGEVVYFKSDGKMGKTDADAEATSYAQAMALATIANDAAGKFLLMGFVRNDSWNWTVGAPIYLSTTAGALTQTPPSGTDDVVHIVGVATHADRMLFRPNSVLAVAA